MKAADESLMVSSACLLVADDVDVDVDKLLVSPEKYERKRW